MSCIIWLPLIDSKILYELNIIFFIDSNLSTIAVDNVYSIHWIIVKDQYVAYKLLEEAI